MRLYRTNIGAVVTQDGTHRLLGISSWDDLFRVDDLSAFLKDLAGKGKEISAEQFNELHIRKPIQSQEIWASGVTYLRSKTARMEESTDGGDCYDRVYNAARPELFFKATPSRAVGPGEELYIRKDSTWNVPEPELTLMINNRGKILGYTIGNDMSSRSIEGENPLYLPQAKTYEKCAALGPCILVGENPLPGETKVALGISRGDRIVFQGDVTLDQMKRSLRELADYLFKACEFPNGCFLMTGTGIIPPDDFSLLAGDEVSITIEPIGSLVNNVAMLRTASSGKD